MSELADNRREKNDTKKQASIHPNKRSAKTIARRRQNYLRNKQIRAELYKAHRSSGWNNQVSTWHETLKALSNGSAG
jgi:hypothetical protein